MPKLRQQLVNQNCRKKSKYLMSERTPYRCLILPFFKRSEFLLQSELSKLCYCNSKLLVQIMAEENDCIKYRVGCSSSSSRVE